MNNNPIGIFDSGVGGLTVVKRVMALQPNESIVYFGDTARVPYGTKSNSTVIEYALQDSAFLLHKGVKVLVVACNTVSSVAMSELRNEFNVPVISMIEPGVEMALNKTQNGKVGVIGTNATITNKAYSSELKRIEPGIEVIEKACPLFVPLAEEGWTYHLATKLIAEEYLKEVIDFGVDTLILGCTHYPILTDIIQEVMGDGVNLIDSGTAASYVVRDYLTDNNLLADDDHKHTHDFYISDVPRKFKDIAERFMGRPIDNVHKVDLEELIEGY